MREWLWPHDTTPFFRLFCATEMLQPCEKNNNSNNLLKKLTTVVFLISMTSVLWAFLLLYVLDRSCLQSRISSELQLVSCALLGEYPRPSSLSHKIPETQNIKLANDDWGVPITTSAVVFSRSAVLTSSFIEYFWQHYNNLPTALHYNLWQQHYHILHIRHS